MARKNTAGEKFLDVRVTGECNNSCLFCRAAKDLPDNTQPKAASLKSILKKNRKNFPSVVFSGGEPTLREDLFELLSFAGKDCGYETVAVATNGRRMVYESYAEEAAAAAGCFLVSLHGHRPALHDYLTGRENSFAETCLGIKNLVSAGADVISRTVITESSCPSIPDIAAVALSLGVRRLSFFMPETAGKKLEDTSGIIPYMTMAARGISRARDLAGELKGAVFAPQFPPCIMESASGKPPAKKKTDWTLVSKLARKMEKFPGPSGPDCGDCRCKDTCQGPPAGYVKLFSWKEFKPINVGS